MRKIIISTIFMSIIVNGVISQTKSNNWIGLNSSISTEGLIRYGGELDGGMGYDGQIGYLFGIGYLRTINDRLDFETGIDYSRNSFKSSYINDIGQTINSINPEHVDLLSIPLNLRIKMNKHFFTTFGIQYDQRFNTIDSPTIDNQTGIGINIKFGKDFRITDKMIVYIAPEIIIHDIVPFYPEKNQQRLTEIGLRISFKFGL